MVHDKLWRQARLRSTKPKLPRTATLCIGCLEERLDRRLTPKDFTALFNECSGRLRDRTKGGDIVHYRSKALGVRRATFASLRYVRPDLTDKEIRQELLRRKLRHASEHVERDD
jgi:hypothetical protein